MNDSLLYQAYGVKDYSYASTEYKGNAIYLQLKTNSPKNAFVLIVEGITSSNTV